MKLLKPVLKKPHVDSPAVPHSAVCLQPGPFVKQNNAEFTNVSCLTSVVMYSTHFTLSGMILLALLTSNNFVQCVCAKIPRESAWGSCLGPLLVGCFSGNCIHIWILDFSCMGACYLLQEGLVHYFLFMFSVLYTKMHWRVYSLADTFGHLNAFLRSE
jgi:hypothetical protein